VHSGCGLEDRPLRHFGKGEIMKTVLIIEDDLSNMQIFCGLLSAQGYNVREATTGREALDAGTRCCGLIDLLLCDLTLPDMSGTNVALELVKSHPEAAILFISGTPRESWNNSDIHNFSNLPPGSADFLEKPFLPSALERKVEGLLNSNTTMSRDRIKPQRAKDVWRDPILNTAS
jgi:CheY-like chemotaxis protein